MSHCVELSSSRLYSSMSRLLYSGERRAKLEADVTLSPSFSLLLRINMLTEAASRREFLSAHSPRLQPVTGGIWRSRNWKQLVSLHALLTAEKEPRAHLALSTLIAWSSHQGGVWPSLGLGLPALLRAIKTTTCRPLPIRLICTVPS